MTIRDLAQKYRQKKKTPFSRDEYNNIVDALPTQTYTIPKVEELAPLPVPPVFQPDKAPELPPEPPIVPPEVKPFSKDEYEAMLDNAPIPAIKGTTWGTPGEKTTSPVVVPNPIDDMIARVTAEAQGQPADLLKGAAGQVNMPGQPIPQVSGAVTPPPPSETIEPQVTSMDQFVADYFGQKEWELRRPVESGPRELEQWDQKLREASDAYVKEYGIGALLKTGLGRLAALLPFGRPVQAMVAPGVKFTPADFNWTLVDAALFGVPTARAGIALARTGVEKAFVVALNAGLDKAIAKIAGERITPEMASVLANPARRWSVIDHNFTVTFAQDNLKKRIAQGLAPEVAARVAADDTVKDIERYLLPKFTETHTGVPGQAPGTFLRVQQGVEARLGGGAPVLREMATPELTQTYKVLQTQAGKIGLDIEAVEGISPGEHWVAISSKTGAKEDTVKWLDTLPQVTSDVIKERLGVSSLKKGITKGKFIPFRSLEDAQRFLTTGDTSAIAKSINLKGPPMTPEDLARIEAQLKTMPPARETVAKPYGVTPSPIVKPPTPKRPSGQKELTPEQFAKLQAIEAKYPGQIMLGEPPAPTPAPVTPGAAPAEAGKVKTRHPAYIAELKKVQGKAESDFTIRQSPDYGPLWRIYPKSGGDDIAAMPTKRKAQEYLKSFLEEANALPPVPSPSAEIPKAALTFEQFKNWDFQVPEGGASKTPKTVLNWDRSQYETLADLAKSGDTFRFNEVLGKGWEKSSGIPNTLSLGAKIHAGEKVTVYRASDVGDIIPGSYVSESQIYARRHGEIHVPGEKAKIYKLDVYPDELMTYDDPHEFIYIPRDAKAEYNRLVDKGVISKPTEKVTPAPVTEGVKPPEVPPAAVVPPAEPPVEPRPAPIVPPPDIPVTPPAGTAAPIPPSNGATQRVFDHISFDPDKPTLAEKFSKGLHEFNTKMIDDLNPLDRFVTEAFKGGVELQINENPYLMARLLRGVASKANIFLEQGTFGKEFWKMEKGKAVPKFTGKGLAQILEPIKDATNLRDFTTYLTAKRSVELSGRNIETGIDVADAKQAIMELEATHKNFPDIAKQVYQYEDALLTYGKEQGLISPELMDKLAKHEAYVPFYRVMEALQSKGFMGTKLADVANPIKRIKGSERMVVNPLESVVKNTYTMISAADRNDIGVMMANLVDKYPQLSTKFEHVKTPIRPVAEVTLKELGIDVKGLTPEEEAQVINIFRPSMKTADDEVTVLINGKKQFYKVDRELKDALLHLDRESLGMIGKILATPARTLRAGATLSPDFVMRNPLRDQWSAMVYSKYGFIPGVDFIRGVAGIVGKTDTYKLFKMSGAEHSMMVSLDREYLSKTFNEVIRGKGPADYIKHPLELLQITSELTEKATRLGEFARGIKSGAVPLEAGYAARDVTLDFAKAGTTAHAVNQIVAFFNANIRGWDKMVMSFKEHPYRTLLKVIVGITIPSILLYEVNKDDPRWDEIPQWQKDIFWIVFAGDTIIRIPKPFELGVIFGSGPERLLEYIDKQNPALAKNFWANFVQAGTPNWLPTAVLPLIENMTNYSFFKGGPIVPQSREAMPPELQYGRWTTETSKKIGELLQYSPAKIDNIINAYTGGLGRYATSGLDAILKGTGISPDITEPTPEAADIPVLKAFIIRNPYGSSSQSVNSVYDSMNQYQEGEKYLKEMLKAGDQKKFDQYKMAHPELLFTFDYKTEESYSASARYLRKVAGQLSDIGKKEDEIYKSTTMSAEVKRTKIDELEKLKTELAKKGLNLLQDDATALISTRLAELTNKLGQKTGEVPVLSIDKTPVNDMKKWWTESGALLEKFKESDVAGDKLAVWRIQTGKILKETDNIPNIKLTSINAEPVDKFGKSQDTYVELYNQWQGRSKLTDPTEIDKFDKAYPDAHLGNMKRAQFVLLQTYHGLPKSEQAQFAKDNEIDLNSYHTYMKEHPNENADLALGGQITTLYSAKAYDKLQARAKEFDIPGNALLDLNIPPDPVTRDAYFKYQDAVNKFTSDSPEARLILAQDENKLRAFLNPGEKKRPNWAIVPALELGIENRTFQDKLDALTSEKAKADLMALPANVKAIDNLARIAAYEKQWKYNNTIADKATVEQGVEVFRLKVQNKPQDMIVNALPTTEAKTAWKLKPENKEYTLNTFRIDALEAEMAKDKVEAYATLRLKELDYSRLSDVDKVAYDARDPGFKTAMLTEKATKEGVSPADIPMYIKVEQAEGNDKKRLLKENRDYYSNVYMPRHLKEKPIDFSKVTTEKFDQFKEEFYDTKKTAEEKTLVRLETPWFDQEGVATGNWTEQFVKSAAALRLSIANQPLDDQFNRLPNKVEKDKFLAARPGYANSRAMIEGLNKGVPESSINEYVEWQSIPAKGWAIERWMMAHRSFYLTVYKGILGNKAMDFRPEAVPSPAIEAQYNAYSDLRGLKKTRYLRSHSALKNWLKKRATLRPSLARD